MTGTETVDFSKLTDAEALDMLKKLDAQVKQGKASRVAAAKQALHSAITPIVEYVVDFCEYTDYGQNGNVWAGYKLPSTSVVIGDETYTVTISLTDTKRKAHNAAEKAKADALKLGVNEPVSLVKPGK